jgi:hypothetical protein
MISATSEVMESARLGRYLTIGTTVNIARRVIIVKRVLNPRFLSYMASYDVASSICQALEGGATSSSALRTLVY